MELNKQSFCL